jgi:hypothetical protein
VGISYFKPFIGYEAGAAPQRGPDVLCSAPTVNRTSSGAAARSAHSAIRGPMRRPGREWLAAERSVAVVTPVEVGGYPISAAAEVLIEFSPPPQPGGARKFWSRRLAA